MRALLFLSMLSLAGGLSAQAPQLGKLLILADAATAEALAGPLEAYRQAMAKDGYDARIVARAWQKPDEIRAVLLSESQNEKDAPPLAGAVFVGNIPIPMLRDAQHLTSAFKMDQERYPWPRSSVPSDRFYDSTLSFDYLKQDEENPLLHYYSLRHDSPQRVNKFCFSARLFPPEPGQPGIERIGRYLERLVRAKINAAPVRRMLLVAGHGYHSESLDSWTSERLVLREQLPRLFERGGWLGAWWHGEHSDLEHIVLRELRRQPLQIALFHAHGAPSKQYLLGNPPAPHARLQVEALKRYLRSRIRRAKAREKSVEAEQVRLMRLYGVPLAWFDGAFDEQIRAEDEKLMAEQDLEADELRDIAVRADFVIFDQCFNGRFHEQPSVANAYLFGPGEVRVTMANTVNVLQDIWANQDLDMLARGESVGALHRRRSYLESHLLGDPTWRFAATAAPGDRAGSDSMLARIRELRGFLAHLVARVPSAEVDAERLRTYLQDPCEFVRRKAAFLIGDIGFAESARPLLEAMLFDPSRRVQFNARSALKKMDPAVLGEAWQQLRTEYAELLPSDAKWHAAVERNLAPPSYRASDLKRLQNSEETLRRRLSAVRSFRNQRVHHLIPTLVAVASDEAAPAQLRVQTIEALGWFYYSHRRAEITTALDTLLRAEALDPAVEREARKTLRRLAEGPNALLTP